MINITVLREGLTWHQSYGVRIRGNENGLVIDGTFEEDNVLYDIDLVVAWDGQYVLARLPNFDADRRLGLVVKRAVAEALGGH